jgi:oxygen-dependent protoporphyrinogen oxidase
MPANTTNSKLPIRIAIIGGGISGLATAWYLQTAVLQHHLAAEIHVYEQSRSARWQNHHHYGKSRGRPICGGGGRRIRCYEVNHGRSQLAQELGIAEQHIGTNMQQRTLYVWKHNQLHRVPKGFQLIVPTQLMPVLSSPLFSWGGKLRFLCERFIPRRRAIDDESLYDFLTRRYGAEIRDTLGIPLMAGIYNADAKQQSMHGHVPAICTI